MNDLEYEYLKRAILKFTDIDIEQYKTKQMRRRLGYFIDGAKEKSVITFCKKLGEDHDLAKRLKDFITINVSEFFRDEQHFRNLKQIVLPDLLQRSRKLNIWSAGCSNGAEVYSIAMILAEMSPGRRHKLLATDVDETILASAKAGGPYPPREVRSIGLWNAEKYFRTSADGYWVTDDIRRRVVFAQHNLLEDLYSDGFDLIVCRNVIIYFNIDVRRRLYTELQQALKPGGVLFVGGSEVIIGPTEFGLIDVLPSFYRKPEVADVCPRPKRLHVPV